MELQNLADALETQGFTCNVQKDTEAGDFAFFGLGLHNGEKPVTLLAKITEGIIYISTVDLYEHVSLQELKGFMYANDLVRYGKFFLSVDINNDEEQEEYAVDYGFEIATEFYSDEMLSTYMNNLFNDLENLELEIDPE